MKRKIAYLTGTRADFGVMSSVLRSINLNSGLELILYATGMHLMPEHGLTIRQVEELYPDVRKIDVVFRENSKLGMAQYVADFSAKFLDQLKKDQVDLILILGDRVEMMAATVIAAYLGLPIAHVHGGDKTMTVDEIARHAITKLSHLHFVATKDSAERVNKLGEEDWRIHTVGAPSLDNTLSKKVPSKEGVYSFLKLDPNQKFILVLQHSTTNILGQAQNQIRETIAAVKDFDLPVVVVYPNADPGGQQIIQEIEKEKDNPQFCLFSSIKYEMFLGVEKEAVVWVGNSSSGIIESASFKTPVVNIGERQKGRPQSGNVIDVDYKKGEIKKAIEKSLYDEEYRQKISRVSNIWGDGKAAERVVKVLESLEIGPKLLTKQITY
jgi:UDP-hydrolysing UDP-N-acetyl-D-glucosamine 2-epimerase